MTTQLSIVKRTKLFDSLMILFNQICQALNQEKSEMGNGPFLLTAFTAIQTFLCRN